MANRLQIFLLQASSSEAVLVRNHLAGANVNLDVRNAATVEELKDTLQPAPDVILLRCQERRLAPLTMVEVIHSLPSATPVVLLCDPSAETWAVEVLKLGAADYVRMDNLPRLEWALRTALRIRQLQSERDRALHDLRKRGAEVDADLAVLRRSEEQYRSIVDGALEGVVIHQNGIIRFANPAAAHLAGYASPGEIIGLNVYETFVAPEARVELRARCAACLRGEPQPLHPGWPGLRRDGRKVWVQSSITLISWQGQPAFLGYFSDSTERWEAEERLRVSEERFSKAFHGSPLPVSIVTLEEGRYLDANPSLIEMVGWNRDEIVGHSALELNMWVDRSHRAALVRVVSQHAVARSFETQLRVKSGAIREVLISAELIDLHGQACMIVVTQDITERKRAEESSRDTEERFRQLADNINKVFWITDSENRRTFYVSPAYEQIWERSCSSLYQNPQSWMDAVHPDDRPQVRQNNILGGSRDAVYRIIRPNGAVRWIRDRAFPIRNSSGEIHRVAGIAEDITEQRDLEEQFRQAQKMEAIGQLAGGIAHDFNNLLTIIQGYASLLLEDSNSPDTGRDAAEQICLASDRAASLVRQLLTFSRRQVMQARDLEINEIIERTGKMLHRILGEDIQLDLHTAPGLPWVHADVGMLEQVLLNLAVNARDAMPNGGRLTVTTGMAPRDEIGPAPNEATNGQLVCVTVSDTGCGIPPEHLNRLFEPFFTTKGVGKGTGLGLATAYGIVRQHRGWIRVDSEVGRGTSFQIFLPGTAPGRPCERPMPIDVSVRGGRETILLVEDEPTLRLLVRSILERYGYEVLEASSGKAALGLWQEHKNRIHLLFTDMVMPDGVSGRELAQDLLRECPELKVIFTSGYSAEVIARDLSLEPGLNFLQKPYDPRLLAGMVRACLDQPSR